ncbi:alpha/beta hydrolase [Streptomyces antimycoticus]|uniref:alpha/beta fold hydrolase n=1 Tax=Streptomyces antimycoticus TaxID=68175 RepID=UPI0034176E8A
MTSAPEETRAGRLVELTDGQVRVYEKGQPDGPALVFLHGFLTSAFTWRNVHPAYTGRYQVILVDLPGSGGSPAPRGGRWDADRWVRLVAELLDELGVDKAILVGSQMGGSLAAWFTALRPERVDRLVLMAAGALGEAEANLTLYRLLAHRRLGPWISRLFPKRMFERRWLAAHGPEYNPEPGVVDCYFRQFRRQGAEMARVGLDLRLSYGERFDALAGPISGLAVPTLLIFGAEDRLVPVSTGQRFASLLPDATLVVLPGCGDFPQEERPKEIAEAVTEFLRKTDIPPEDR